MDFWRGVGSREGGMEDGKGRIGMRSAFPHSVGIWERMFKRDMFVRVARRTLYWIRGMRWSGVKGKVMGPEMEMGFGEVGSM
jgi:hypothetical protein